MRSCEPAHPWIVVAVQGFVGEEHLQFTVGSRRRASRSLSPESGGLPSSPDSPSSSERRGAEGGRGRGWSRSRSAEGKGPEEIHDANTADVTLVLISRRQWRRAGTRYHHRGIDDHGAPMCITCISLLDQIISFCLLRGGLVNAGNVANHVETEQILRAPNGRVSSFVQVRGSAPVHFMQRHAVGKTKPTPILTSRHEVTHMAFCRHVAHIQRRFGTFKSH